MTARREFRHRGEADGAPYRYTECGLDGIYLRSGYTVHKTPYGEGVSVRNTEDLHKAIGLYLVEHRKALSGKEVRFLRNALDLTQSELAQLLGCDSQTVARWEKEQTEMPPATDRLLRLLFLEDVAGVRVKVKNMLETFDEREDDTGRVVFVADKKGWRAAA